jgi:acetylcholinesterase
MDRDVVVVTINYRVGAFGFLAIGSKEAAGNMGLKDQVLALKWIKTNIVKFGGNPDSVTIAGLSAGGFSVTAHMASEMSQGLFHRVIAMSGAITGISRIENNNYNFATHIAINLNCTTANSEAMMRCLREVRKIMQECLCHLSY